jgi:hypothetical protein
MRWTRSPAFIAVFVLLDVIVLILAYVLMHRETAVDPSTAGASPSAGGSGTANPIEGPLYLAASPKGGLLRSTRGSCDSRAPSQARVWVAASFKAPLKTVRVPGLQESLGLRMDDDRIEIVGAGTDCKVSGFVSTDDGRSWRKGSVPKDIWYLDTDTTLTAVHGPLSGGVANIDCTPVSVTTLGSGRQAFVACSDVNVMELSAKKDVSPTVFIVTAPAGVAKPGTGQPIVLAALSECGAAVVRITSQQDAKSLACLGDDGAPLGLASSGDRIFAQVGFKVMVSSNRGVNFTTYPGESAG